ncbi:hypothetical protein J3Q64DRAFT_1713607 [Phycomyces blakesleeanus]|uniref:Uncharacterized protein n=1 Tax=Phycomyces blakesleeanus TaxID=4837 RepID=A0ABR3BG12_PHYBL
MFLWIFTIFGVCPVIGFISFFFESFAILMIVMTKTLSIRSYVIRTSLILYISVPFSTHICTCMKAITSILFFNFWIPL